MDSCVSSAIGGNALHLCAEKGDYEVAKFLLNVSEIKATTSSSLAFITGTSDIEKDVSSFKKRGWRHTIAHRSTQRSY